MYFKIILSSFLLVNTKKRNILMQLALFQGEYKLVFATVNAQRRMSYNQEFYSLSLGLARVLNRHIGHGRSS